MVVRRVRLGLCCAEVHHGTVLGVAMSYFIGYYQVALETGTKFVPQITGSSLFVCITARWIRICRSPCGSFNASNHE